MADPADNLNELGGLEHPAGWSINSVDLFSHKSLPDRQTGRQADRQLGCIILFDVTTQ